MFNLKAFIIGSLSVIIIGLTLQLAYVLIATYISIADKDGFFSIYQAQLWFIAALLVYSLTMLLGGAITALLSDQRGLLTPALVGLSTSLLSLLTSSSGDDYTWLSGLIVVGSAGFCMLGAKYTLNRCRTARS